MSEPTDAASAWPASVAAERGIRRALTAHGRVDVAAPADGRRRQHGRRRRRHPPRHPHRLHPRARPARRHPRPGHDRRARPAAPSARSTSASTTGSAPAWCTASPPARTTARCSPGPSCAIDSGTCSGIDIGRGPGAVHRGAEGIDLAVSAAAAAEAVAAQDAPPRPGAVADAGGSGGSIAGLPEHRRGLPLALSVGRLHRVKGMATVVEAWASDPALRDRCNLLIVGGDLDAPVGRRARAARAHRRRAVADNPAAATGLVLAGHRPNDVVARLDGGRARSGWRDAIAPGGVYVCGSLKEEFGLAMLEALAAGLVVVAPDGGGPATYVEDGVTGFLVDTRSPREVGAGIAAALDLRRPSPDDDRAGRRRSGSGGRPVHHPGDGRHPGRVYAVRVRRAGDPGDARR